MLINVSIFNIEKSDIRIKKLMFDNNYKLIGETPSNWIFIQREKIREDL